MLLWVADVPPSCSCPSRLPLKCGVSVGAPHTAGEPSWQPMSTPVKAREGRTWQCPPQGPPSPPGSRWWRGRGAHPCPSSSPGTTREGPGSGRAKQRGQMEVVALLGPRRPRAEGRPPLRPRPSSPGPAVGKCLPSKLRGHMGRGGRSCRLSRPLSWAAWPPGLCGAGPLGVSGTPSSSRAPGPATCPGADCARTPGNGLSAHHTRAARPPPAGPWCLRPLSPKNGPRCAFPWAGPGLALRPLAPAFWPSPPGVRARLGCGGPVLRGS